MFTIGQKNLIFTCLRYKLTLHVFSRKFLKKQVDRIKTDLPSPEFSLSLQNYIWPSYNISVIAIDKLEEKRIYK